MIKSIFASFGSVLTAVAASSCCIGPLALTLLGIGGVGFGAGLEKYRPVMLLATFALLGVAFYLVYRPAEKVCDDGSCEVNTIDKMRKINKIVLWLATGFAVLFMFAPKLLLIL